MLTKYFRKNNLPFLPFLLSIEEKMSEKIVPFFRKKNLKLLPLCSQ